MTRDELLPMIDATLAPGAEFALFYFAGHGTPVRGDVALVTSDGTEHTPGVQFSEVLERITESPVQEIVVILIAASPAEQPPSALLVPRWPISVRDCPS